MLVKLSPAVTAPMITMITSASTSPKLRPAEPLSTRRHAGVAGPTGVGGPACAGCGAEPTVSARV